MKVQITINDDLLRRVDRYASDNYMSRSGFISTACNDYLAGVEMKYALRDLALACRKIADTGEVDAETQKQLDDFQRLANLMTSK